MVLYTCEYCNKQFQGKTDYTRHIQSHQRKEEKEREKQQLLELKNRKPVICEECGNGYRDKYTLKIHKNTTCKYRVKTLINNMGGNEFALNNKISQLEHKLEVMTETNREINESNKKIIQLLENK